MELAGKRRIEYASDAIIWSIHCLSLASYIQVMIEQPDDTRREIVHFLGLGTSNSNNTSAATAVSDPIRNGVKE